MILWVYFRNENPGYIRLCKLSQKFRTLHFNGHVDHTKGSKIVAIRHFLDSKNYKNCFCCRGPTGELTALPDPVVAFKGRVVAGRGKGREEAGRRM